MAPEKSPPKHTRLEDIAESAWLKIVGRGSGIIIMALIFWAGNSLEQLNTGMASVMQELNDHDKRIATIEERLNLTSYMYLEKGKP